MRVKPDCCGAGAKKLDMRAIIRTAAVTLAVVTVGWSGCQSTHSDARTPTPGAASAEPAPEAASAPVPTPAEAGPSTIPPTVQHTQRGMENMPPPSPAVRPAPQTGKTLALSGPPRVPVRGTNQPAPATSVVTQAPPVPDKTRVVVGPIRFQGPPRHKASMWRNQQMARTGLLGGLAFGGVGLLVLMRRVPLWREKLRTLVQRKRPKKHNGPRLVLEGAPQRQSPLGED
jgi:hypothetical protein